MICLADGASTGAGRGLPAHAERAGLACWTREQYFSRIWQHPWRYCYSVMHDQPTAHLPPVPPMLCFLFDIFLFSFSRLVHDACLHARGVQGCSRCSVLLFYFFFFPVLRSWRARMNHFGPANGHTHASCGTLNPCMANTRAAPRAICSRSTHTHQATQAHIEERKGPSRCAAHRQQPAC